jgi:hypothetical protein
MNKYQQGKARAIEKAQEWQRDASKIELDWLTYANTVSYFEELAKRYGLVKEFKENGII